MSRIKRFFNSLSLFWNSRDHRVSQAKLQNPPAIDQRIRRLLRLAFLVTLFLLLSSASSSLAQEPPPPDWRTYCSQPDPDFPEGQSCACTLMAQCQACCSEYIEPDVNPIEGCFLAPAEKTGGLAEQFYTCFDNACNSWCVRGGYTSGGAETTDIGTATSTHCACTGPRQPPPQTVPTSASIQLQPTEGPPAAEVQATGQGFPPDVNVELHWDSEDGESLGTERSDSSGGLLVDFLIPVDVEEGEHQVYAVYNDVNGRNWASAPFRVRLLCIYGQVILPLRDGLPLQGVEVRMWWSDPTQTFIPILVTDSVSGATWVATDPQGNYRICHPLISLPSRDWLLQVRLREVRFGIFELIDVPTEEFAQGFFGQDRAIGANLDDVKTWFTLENENDLERNLRFEDLGDKTETSTVREDHALDSALIYYHLHQAMRFYLSLNATISPSPVPIFVFSNISTSTGGSGIAISVNDSEWDDANAPKNREWHEFSHYVMRSIYGGFPPTLSENPKLGLAGDMNGNHIWDQDVNHAPYLLNALSSSDALVEGFAEAMTMIIADQMNQAGEPYMQDTLPPYIYTVTDDKPYPELLNFEINYPQNVIPSLPADKRKQIYDLYKSTQERSLYESLVPEMDEYPLEFARGDEENCVASLLWDLYDPQNPAEKDPVQIPLEQLWSILTGTYMFPRYYDSNIVTSFTGDEDVFKSKFVYYDLENKLGSFNVLFDRVYPTMTRNIWYIKDLYDALTRSLPDQVSGIDQVFQAHKVYVDTFRMYEDYQSSIVGSLSTFSDSGASVQAGLNPQAAYQFWPRGVVADLQVSGWGAGFTVDKPSSFDGRGYLYVWAWVNAPPGDAFYIVVEDGAGQWLYPAVSRAYYDVDDPATLNLPDFQGGTGAWTAYAPAGMAGGPYPYVAVLDPSRHGAGLNFQPNPYYKTPAQGTSGPDLTNIRGVGLLFTTPGVYQVMLGGIVFTADYPWKPGMRSIIGLGDSAQGIYLPYRRDHPTIPGSKALIQVDRLPATLLVTQQYGPPYENLSFSYPLQLSSLTQEIFLYIEPAFEGQENLIRLTAQGEGKSPGKPIEISSTAYWDQIGKEEYVLQTELTTRQGLSWLPWALCCLALVGIAVVVAVIIVALMIFRRSKR